MKRKERLGGRDPFADARRVATIGGPVGGGSAGQIHVLATTTGLGPLHSVSGLTAGQFLRATGPNAAAFQVIADGDLPATIVRTSRQVIAGAGLTGGGALSADVTLNVGAGDGITVAAYAVAVNLASPSGLSFATGALQLDDSVAGAGLTISSKVLAVGAGTLVSVGADSVGLANGSAQYQVPVTGATPFTPAYVALSTFAGGGLVFSAGVFAVGAGTGISVAADAVNLADTAVTPGTYGSATQSATVTIDQQGRITLASNTTISGVTPAAHNLLSAQHGDTAAQGVSRGSLIYCTVTPPRGELVHPRSP